ncbi:tripartite tricarboxylate transporter substrate binding protein [Bordetella sp. LUAb4]|uniref:Bug family tripartite tricarboxylate transporter substrate binding protein n=1 Tax=Bordetella sp. LUAb4 TaxID=2843195 RepID=UPI001E44F091|nr:tripartite tricarboxylate transporter substrate binding protein [Bordetella sp. LUAb4]
MRKFSLAPPARIILATLATAAALVSSPGQAQTAFPDRPVRLVIPYAAGGSLDVVGRVLAEKFQAQTGQTLIVDNRGGAAGQIAADYVARAQPDGYTLLLGTAAQTSIANAYFKKLPYDPLKDLIPVSLLVNTSNILFVSTDFPATTIAQLRQQVKDHPGEVSYGSPGNGSVSHLATALFEERTGMKLLHVPYRGAAPALNDLAAGRISLLFTLLASAKPVLDSGKVRALAVAGPKRVPSLPDVPTLKEAGIDGADSGVWIGVLAPKGTPDAVVDKLNDVIMTALRAPDLRKRLADSGADLAPMGPREFGAMITQDAKTWKDVVAAAHIQME